MEKKPKQTTVVQKAPEVRQNIVGLILGGRGTGKTSYIKKVLIENHKQKKVLIFDIDNNEAFQTVNIDGEIKSIPAISAELLPKWKTGIVRVIDVDSEKVINLIEQHIYNTLIIFEDATKYITGAMPENIKSIVLASKQKNNDVFFTFHSFGSTRPEFFKYSNFLTIFKTFEELPNTSAMRYKISKFDAVLRVKKWVDEHESKYCNASIRIS